MTNGFEEARERRNWLERLMDKIPGFKGFQNRELRRDVDKLQREHLAAEIDGLKRLVRQKTRAYTDSGRIQALTLFDRLDRRLDGLGQAIRFADYGFSGLFDVVKFFDEELEKLYEFDLSLLGDLAELRASVEAVPEPGSVDPGDAVAAALDQVGAIEEKWARRKTVVSDVVKSSQGNP